MLCQQFLLFHVFFTLGPQRALEYCHFLSRLSVRLQGRLSVRPSVRLSV